MRAAIMASGHRGGVLREIGRVFSHGTATALDDGPLLRRAAGGDPVAFEAMVERHGPMVLGVCRRMLRDPNDVDDAFQATFLVLVRKAGSLRGDDGVGPWLHGVASKVAARARADSARRATRESRAARDEAVRPIHPTDDLRSVLDREIARLPKTYRRPVVLCYLEGKTHEEAARRLRLTTGALRGRLDRARDRLRTRLARRGLAPVAGLTASALLAETAPAAVPSPLMSATIAVAGRAATGRAALLADGVLRTMFLAKVKLASAVAVALFASALPFALTCVRDDKADRPPDPPRAIVDDAPLTGRVVDRAGRPIVAARIALGSDLRDGRQPETTTDSSGRFAFRDVKPGPIVLTVQTGGYAPDLKELPADRVREPVEFRLGPSLPIFGRMVDPEGRPIAGAPISVESWRGHHSLRWSGETDAEGRFRWEDAPDDKVLFDVGQQGFEAKRYWQISASGKEVEIQMRRPLLVRGSVSDAETGRPIEAFTLVPGVDWGGRPVIWKYDRTRRFSGGRYDVKLSTTEPTRLVRIEAEGYLPGESRVFQSNEREVTFDFQLRRGAWLSGVVRLPDGSPLAGADVVMVTPAYPAFFKNGRPPDGRDQHIIKSGPDGRFAFPKEVSPFTVVVVHDRGFAERNPEQVAGPPDVKLTPWGRVEGTVRIGSRPGAGERLNLAGLRSGDTPKAVPWVSDEATADDSGRFVFERVIPGEASVSRAISVGPNPSGLTTTGYSHSVAVEVKPGGTASVSIGGTGRPVVGRVAIPGNLAGRVDWSNGLDSLRGRPRGPASLGRIVAGKSSMIAVRNYVVKLDHDGSFRVDDVEAGVYDLMIVVHEHPTAKSHPAMGGEVIGRVQREVSVPPIPGGRSDEPIDLGAIPLVPVERP